MSERRYNSESEDDSSKTKVHVMSGCVFFSGGIFVAWRVCDNPPRREQSAFLVQWAILVMCGLAALWFTGAVFFRCCLPSTKD